LCHQVYEKKILEINAWEDDRILQLEDYWLEAENDDDVSGEKDDDENPYHLACEEIVREAEMKRASVREQMNEHRSNVEKLVEDARRYLATHKTPQEDHLVEYVFFIVAVCIAGYVMFY
jgi:hypothetical protein